MGSIPRRLYRQSRIGAIDRSLMMNVESEVERTVFVRPFPLRTAFV